MKFVLWTPDKHARGVHFLRVLRTRFLWRAQDLLLDRGMMGDGVIDIPAARALVEAQGYDGMHEVEIFSSQDWWKRPPDEGLATCKARHLACC